MRIPPRYSPPPAVPPRREAEPSCRGPPAAVGARLTLPDGKHPWAGRTFAASWGTRETLNDKLVHPNVVIKVAVEVAQDTDGRWRHPVRVHRVWLATGIDDAPLFDETDERTPP